MANDAPVRVPTDTGDPPTLHVRGAHAPIVGRTTEVEAVGRELEAALSARLAGISLEGEPGIGKTRLLAVAEQAAAARGFATIAVAGDEEIRGPFLLARALLRAGIDRAGSAATAATLKRALDAITGRDEPGLGTLSADDQLLRVFDLSAVAVTASATEAPLAILVDDIQWADEDSVRMLRYLVRTVADVPLFLGFTVRPDELGDREASRLLADLERMGMLRRLPLERMTPTESGELLSSVLGGSVDASSAATVHAQAEGVPFILEEIARTYRDAGLIHRIDDRWTLAKNAGRLVPSAVRTLIQRRAARLPAPTRQLLAEAAVLGRRFNAADLVAVKRQLGDAAGHEVADLADLLDPAVSSGLLTESQGGDGTDYRFVHEQVREHVAGTLAPARRRAIHLAVVDLLAAGGEATEESLPVLAEHAIAAGDVDRAARYAIDAARAALAARAPDETSRIVESALPIIDSPRDRVALLVARDDALEMLPPADRLEGLAELAALAEALADSRLELEVELRRAGALRLAGEFDRARDLAGGVRTAATQRDDRQMLLAACLELGQDHLGKPLGESYTPSHIEVDLEAAEEAFACARELATEQGDLPALAAATRELGVIGIGRVREWYVTYKRQHGMDGVLSRIAAGEDLDLILTDLGVSPLVRHAEGLLEDAVVQFERLGDKRGLMSTIIALAYLRFAPDVHLNASAKRIEEIRHLAIQLVSLSRASERERAEAQMLYGVHVFARAKVVPDLAIERGEEACRKAHVLGERSLEFLAAGGVAMVQLDLDDLDRADHWVDAAATAAHSSPTPFKARQLELWRASCCAARLDVDGARTHLDRAVELATAQRRAAARCEALAHYAQVTASLGERTGEAELLHTAERRAADAKAIMPSLPGHPLWGARADAALVRVRLVRGDTAGAAAAARSALEALEAADVEDLDLDIRIPAARGMMAGGAAPERQRVRQLTELGLMLVAQRILDEQVRVRWFLGPTGRELTELVGSIDREPLPEDVPGRALSAEDAELLRLIVEGRTNREIAVGLGLTEEEVARVLAGFYGRIGSRSQAGATAFVLRERVT
jgi:DNA-binding CsgD family transcriptional regulator